MLEGKRILFFLPGLELGGAERQALYLARHLKNLGCDIRVWGNNAPGLASEMFQAMGIPWKIMPSSWPCRKQHYLRFLWRVLKTVRALRIERPDVILNYCPRPCISSGLAWRFTPVKACIWGQRDTDDLRGDLVERIAYRSSSAVICNAEHEIEYLRQTLGNTNAPIFIIHNGIEVLPCEKTRTEWRAEINIPKDAVVATMLANFRYQKDHSTLLRAWRQVLLKMQKDTSHPYLLLAGAQHESYQTVYQLAADLKLHNSVKFLGQIKDSYGLLNASDIGVLITLHEGLPNVVIEYMASALPVVATELAGNREALGYVPGNILCRPGDPDDLSSGLERLVMDSALRKQVGDRNRQRAEKEFSVNTMCEKTVRIINDLINNGTNNPRR